VTNEPAVGKKGDSARISSGGVAGRARFAPSAAPQGPSRVHAVAAGRDDVHMILRPRSRAPLV